MMLTKKQHETKVKKMLMTKANAILLHLTTLLCAEQLHSIPELLTELSTAQPDWALAWIKLGRNRADDLIPLVHTVTYAQGYSRMGLLTILTYVHAYATALEEHGS